MSESASEVSLSALPAHAARFFGQAPHWHLLAALPAGDAASGARALARLLALLPAARRLPECPSRLTLTAVLPAAPALAQVREAGGAAIAPLLHLPKIGRASCRERV